MKAVRKNKPSENQSFFKRIFAILVFVLFLNLFFFHDFGSVTFGLIFLGVFFFLTFVINGRTVQNRELISASSILIPLLLFCLGIVLRANIFIQIVLGLATITTLLVYAYVLSSKIPMVRSLFELILAPAYFVGTYIKTAFKSIGILGTGDYEELHPERTSTGKSSLVWSVVIGLIVGLFVIGILISMFSNADPIFATFVKNVLSADFLQNLTKRVIFSVLIALILIPFLTLRRDRIFTSPIGLFKRLNFVHEMSVVMILVALVMGLFLIIQWPYVFAKVPFETDLSKFGVVTYSEYVRKGFSELLKIALFVYGLIWAGLVILRENKSQGKNILKYIQVLVLFEFVIFLFSIFRRVWLYQEYHGWSLIRIYGSFLLLWILGITIFLALRHFWQRRWVIGEMIFTALIIFLIGVLNVESFIVNNHPPTVNKKVDYVYLSRMSADGYVGWEKAFTHAKTVIDKYSKEGSLLTKEERKEIAYTGIIIRELLQNYKDLIKHYGTQDDIKQYLDTTFAFQKEANTTMALQRKNDPTHGTDIQQLNKNITEIQKLIQEDKADYKKIFNSFYVSTSPDKYQFTSAGTQSFYDIPYFDEFFTKQITTDTKVATSKIDLFYTWNASKINAYEGMKKNINYVELLQLQKQYFNIHKRILSQPSDQRDYDMDISLNSPLL